MTAYVSTKRPPAKLMNERNVLKLTGRNGAMERLPGSQALNPTFTQPETLRSNPFAIRLAGLEDQA